MPLNEPFIDYRIFMTRWVVAVVLS